MRDRENGFGKTGTKAFGRQMSCYESRKDDNIIASAVRVRDRSEYGVKGEREWRTGVVSGRRKTDAEDGGEGGRSGKRRESASTGERGRWKVSEGMEGSERRKHGSRRPGQRRECRGGRLSAMQGTRAQIRASERERGEELRRATMDGSDRKMEWGRTENEGWRTEDGGRQRGQKGRSASATRGLRGSRQSKGESGCGGQETRCSERVPLAPWERERERERMGSEEEGRVARKEGEEGGLRGWAFKRRIESGRSREYLPWACCALPEPPGPASYSHDSCALALTLRMLAEAPVEQDLPATGTMSFACCASAAASPHYGCGGLGSLPRDDGIRCIASGKIATPCVVLHYPASSSSSAAAAAFKRQYRLAARYYCSPRKAGRRLDEAKADGYPIAAHRSHVRRPSLVLGIPTVTVYGYGRKLYGRLR
ncbi:hypothetical protein DFH09DRAFT_1067560 [Mycena vulgaris]|nr:hypothetical protein DFH09DRAFT_1067560 [Mycena vulgaris]